MTTPLPPQAELIRSYQRLVEELQGLATSLKQSVLPLWIPLTDTEKSLGLSAIDKAIEYYCDIWYQDNQDGRLTRSCHGLVAAAPQVLEQCQNVNFAKTQFKSIVQAIRSAPKGKQWITDLNQRTPQLRQDLNHKGLGRLHLKQCYRLIPIAPAHPYRAGFNWYTSGRSIRKVSASEIEQKLVKMGLDKPHIKLQFDLLRQLTSNTPLAQVQQQAPLMRANLRYSEQNSTQNRTAINLSLPLLFPWDSKRPFPEYNEPPLTPPDQRRRQVRSDCIIEEHPFLPSLRIHRYQQ